MRLERVLSSSQNNDQFYKSMFGDHPNDTIITYGRGRFNPSSPGYRPSPIRSFGFSENRLRNVHNAIGVKTENSTPTRSCPQCHTSVKMCGVATWQEPFMTTVNVVGNRHFVHRCTNNLCRVPVDLTTENPPFRISQTDAPGQQKAPMTILGSAGCGNTYMLNALEKHYLRFEIGYHS
ncbi:hypothetical protein INT44_006093 [Umbelopsis vinacea]|uniref:Uncharacterized protein n=1 Tax=Umbelopsis vinacea TaxID=44442 RepID=A0A8H7UIM4_9FUNG|nr:hypothetical protein INT44_006093 [Umbelopsis vinacea]